MKGKEDDEDFCFYFIFLPPVDCYEIVWSRSIKQSIAEICMFGQNCCKLVKIVLSNIVNYSLIKIVEQYLYKLKHRVLKYFKLYVI